MQEIPIITDITFSPVKKRESLIGFVDFLYDGKFKIQGVGVHSILDYPDQYRLVYPNNLTDGRATVFPIKREISKLIDGKITEYVNEQLNKGVKYDPKIIKGRSKSLPNGNKD